MKKITISNVLITLAVLSIFLMTIMQGRLDAKVCTIAYILQIIALLSALILTIIRENKK